MQKKLIALAVAGVASSAALAQMNVTISGRLETSIDHLSGQVQGGTRGSNTSMRSGQYSGQSHITFSGSEDLGGGLKLDFSIANRFSGDGNNGGGFPTGTGGQTAPGVGTDGSGLTGSRASWLKFSGSMGDITFGRFGNASGDYYAADYDPFQDVGVGGVTLFSQSAEFGLSAVNNAIRYRTPTMSGFQVIYELAMSENQDKVSNTQAGTQSIISGSYNQGPLSLTVSQSFTRNSNGGQAVSIGRNFTATGFMGSYDFGAVKLMAQTWKEITSKASGDTDNLWNQRTSLIGASVPMGPHTYKISYRRYDDGRTNNIDTNSWTIGYDYKFSKRTTGFAAYSQLSNTNSTSGTNSFFGGTTNGLQMGVSHRF